MRRDEARQGGQGVVGEGLNQLAVRNRVSLVAVQRVPAGEAESVMGGFWIQEDDVVKVEVEVEVFPVSAIDKCRCCGLRSLAQI